MKYFYVLLSCIVTFMMPHAFGVGPLSADLEDNRSVVFLNDTVSPSSLAVPLVQSPSSSVKKSLTEGSSQMSYEGKFLVGCSYCALSLFTLSGISIVPVTFCIAAIEHDFNALLVANIENLILSVVLGGCIVGNQLAMNQGSFDNNPKFYKIAAIASVATMITGWAAYGAHNTPLAISAAAFSVISAACTLRAIIRSVYGNVQV